MLRIKFTMSILLVLLLFRGYTQGVEGDMENIRFYQQMALSDAQLEQNLEFSSEEDEADYWKDQLNFEKHLKEVEYSAYKTYISFKRKAYLEHQENCDISINHGKGYNRQSFFYRTHGLMDKLNQVDVSKNFSNSAVLASQQN